MKIIYIITKVITYPGAFLKGFWEHIICRMLGIKITDNNYLAFDYHGGHVKHEPAHTAAKAFLLAFLPYLLQRIFGWIFLLAGSPILLFGLRSPSESYLFWLYAVALFFGLSLLCNSFAQWEDALHQWQMFYGKDDAYSPQRAGRLARVLLWPCNVWLLVGAWLERTGIATIVLFGGAVAAVALYY